MTEILLNIILLAVAIPVVLFATSFIAAFVLVMWDTMTGKRPRNRS